MGEDRRVDWIIAPTLCNPPVVRLQLDIPIFCLPRVAGCRFSFLGLWTWLFDCLGQWDASRCDTSRDWRCACVMGLTIRACPGWPIGPWGRLEQVEQSQT